MSDRLRIGVCGFGVAGGAISILLARAGHEVTLLERAPQVGPVGAGFMLQPSGQRVLKELGLLERIAGQSARIERIEGFTHSGRRLTDLRYSRVSPEACAYGVHRGVLFEELHAAVLSTGVTIELSAEVSDWRENSSSAVVQDVAGRTHGPFDLIVGADGARSLLREKLNPGIGRREYKHGALWGTGLSTKPVDSLHQVTRGTRRLSGLMPIGGGRCTFFWGLAASELDSLKARGFAAFRDEVVDMFPMAAEVLDDVGGFERMTFGGYQYALPKCVHNDRVVLLGDAAHAMSPHLGQGANLALVDAECLARHLAMRTIPDALWAYRDERRSQTRYFATLSRFLSPFFQSNSAVLALGRDLGLPVLCAVPWIRCQMELSAAGLKQGILDQLWRT